MAEKPKPKTTKPRSPNLGGARLGAGRPKGSAQKITTQARKEAKAAGLLPHEWLLLVCRGDGIKQMVEVEVRDKRTGRLTGEVKLEEKIIYPAFDVRIDAAKAAAPYYAPKLAVRIAEGGEGGAGGSTKTVVDALRELAKGLPV